MPARNTRGFTLLELMVVVAIIGILASIAVPSFMKFQCKSKQSEAKTTLKAVYTTQVAYNGEFGTYLNLTDLTSYGGLFPDIVRGRYYTVTLPTFNASQFAATANAPAGKIAGNVTPDRWALDHLTPFPSNSAGNNACK